MDPSTILSTNRVEESKDPVSDYSTSRVSEDPVLNYSTRVSEDP